MTDAWNAGEFFNRLIAEFEHHRPTFFGREGVFAAEDQFPFQHIIEPHFQNHVVAVHLILPQHRKIGADTPPVGILLAAVRGGRYGLEKAVKIEGLGGKQGKITIRLLHDIGPSLILEIRDGDRHLAVFRRGDVKIYPFCGPDGCTGQQDQYGDECDKFLFHFRFHIFLL